MLRRAGAKVDIWIERYKKSYEAHLIVVGVEVLRGCPADEVLSGC
jgi:hypothetical protein